MISLIETSRQVDQDGHPICPLCERGINFYKNGFNGPRRLNQFKFHCIKCNLDFLLSFGIWLDDERNPKLKGIQEHFGAEEHDNWCKTPASAIKLLKTGMVTRISLDYDLGPSVGTGLIVAEYIREQTLSHNMNEMKISLHTHHLTGKLEMKKVLRDIREYWIKRIVRA